MKPMHISEKIAAELIAQGWRDVDGQGEQTFKKRIENFAPAGTVSNGTRVVTLTIDCSGRWLSRIDGWGNVEKDVDLRNYLDNPQQAIEDVLK